MTRKRNILFFISLLCGILKCNGTIESYFSAPPVEHISYSIQHATVDKITLLSRNGSGDTELAHAVNTGYLSGKSRVDMTGGSVQFVLRTLDGTTLTETVVHTLSPATSITGRAQYDETIVLTAPATSSGFMADAGISVTLDDNDMVSWGDAMFDGLGEITLNNCGFSKTLTSSASYLELNSSTVQGQTTLLGETVRISDCLFNSLGNPVCDLQIHAATDVSMTDSEVAGSSWVYNSCNVTLNQNTFYGNVWLREDGSEQVILRNSTIFGGISLNENYLADIDQNYYGAPASKRNTVYGWLNPWHLEKVVPCLNDAPIVRSSRSEPRNTSFFRNITMAAGQSVMVRQSGTGGQVYYPENFTGTIRKGRPFAMSFDLKSSAEKLSGVTYELEYDGITYQPASPFTAEARRKVPSGSDYEKLALSFILPAPTAIGTNTWALYADFSSCSANIVKPSSDRVWIANGGIPIQPGFARPLCIGVIEIELKDGSPIPNCAPSARSKAIARIKKNLKLKLGLLESEIEMVDQGLYSFTGGWISSWISQTDIGRANQLTTELEWFLGDYNKTVPTPLDFIIGVVPVNGLGGADGLSQALRRGTVLVDETTPDAALHELGHSMGLYTGTEQYDLGYSYTQYGYLSKGRGLDLAAMSAFNGSGVASTVVPSGTIRHFPACMHNSVYDIMGCRDPSWISGGTYDSMNTWLIEHLGLTGSAPGTSAMAVKAVEKADETYATRSTDRIIHVGAILSSLPEGKTILASSVRAEEIPNGNGLSAGIYNMPYQFRTYDSTGTRLSYVQCMTPCSTLVTNSFWEQFFSVPENAVEYRLVYTLNLNPFGGSTIWTRASEGTLTNELDVVYDASPDAYELSWTNSGTLRTTINRLLVSDDGGTSWTPRPLPVYTNTVVIPRARLGINNPQFKLFSSDGSQAAVSLTSTGRLFNSSAAPVVDIVSPREGDQGMTNLTWQLTADAYDANDDLDSVQWFSSIDGSLGGTSSMQTTLSPGNHQLSAVATDTSGLATTSQVQVAVGNLTNVDLALSASDVALSPRENGYGLNAVGFNMTNCLNITFRNQGVSNSVQIQVYLTRPGESETTLTNTTWSMAAFDSCNASLDFNAPTRGDYRARAVCTALDIPDSNTNNNDIIVVYTNQPPQIFANRISVLTNNVPLEVPLAAQDPNGDTVTFSLIPTAGASLTNNILHFDNGGVPGSYAIRFTASDGILTSDAATLRVDVYDEEPSASRLSPVITSSSSFSAISGVPISITITADNGPCTFSSGTLPGGLSLDGSSGIISGQIDAVGTYDFTVTAQNPVDSDTTDITLTVDAAPPPNDDFADAKILSGASVATTGTTAGATREAGEPDHADSSGSSSRSVWYRWTALENGVVAVSWNNIQFMTVGSGIYTGSTLTDLIEQGSASGMASPFNPVYPLACFNAVAGQEYFIAIEADGTSTFDLTLEYHAEPVLRSPLSITTTQGDTVDVTFETWNTATSFSSTDLPDGLSLDPENGHLTGSFNDYGNYSTAITLSNSAGSSSNAVDFKVYSTEAPKFLSPMYATATLGEPFLYNLQTTNIATESLFVGTLPNGLSFESSSRTILGTPSQTGAFDVSVYGQNYNTYEMANDILTLLVRDPYETWRFESGLSNPAFSSPDDDYDADGASNYEEFIARTDPTDPDSVLKIYLRKQGAGFVVFWPGQTSCCYQVQSADSLQGGFSDISNYLYATPPTNTLAVPADSSTEFFRIRVQE